MYTVYSKPACPQCVQATTILEQHGLPYKKLIIDVGQEKLDNEHYTTVQELKVLLPLVKSVPQIFKNGVHVGGLTELIKSLK